MTGPLSVTSRDVAYPAALQAGAPTDPRRLIAVIGLALFLAYGVFLAGSFLQGTFARDTRGHGIPNDYANVWGAGRLVLEGRASEVYDSPTHHAKQEEGVGRAFDAKFPWHYPPPFLFAAALAAVLPFTWSMLAWLFVTGIPYAMTMRAIIGGPAGVLFACGFPGALWTVTAGHNGFLWSALIGGALLKLDRNPAFAGMCLGLLTFKPQLGLLFPVVLVATGRWRVIAWAAATTLALAALSFTAFGATPWLKSSDTIALAGQLVLTDGVMGWGRLQSVFGLVRAFGGSETLATAVHVGFVAAGSVALCLLWRSRADDDLKAAALSLGVMLATPYLLSYDTVLLSVPAAFLIRDALAREFTLADIIGLPLAGALILSYIVTVTQVGLVAGLILALLIAMRLRASQRSPTSAASTPISTPGLTGLAT
jgi:hypothetical protein